MQGIRVNVEFNDINATKLLRKALFKGMLKCQELAIRKVPVDTGMLKASIKLEPNTAGSNKYVLSAGVDYALYVEYGTKPHFPPLEPLKKWSRRVLGDESAAYAVAQKIAKYGTKSQPFFRPAMMEVQYIWLPQYINKIIG
jgi:hypothetical protein